MNADKRHAAQLKGNEQADQVQQGLGSIGSLKKDL
jgi:hypothetical protein